jgi:hypothetical protein
MGVSSKVANTSVGGAPKLSSKILKAVEVSKGGTLSCRQHNTPHNTSERVLHATHISPSCSAGSVVMMPTVVRKIPATQLVGPRTAAATTQPVRLLATAAAPT